MDDRTKKISEILMDKPIAFQRIFKTITGSTVAALFLSQAWYWSKNKATDSRNGWFYKSAREWEEETGLTRREQETARRICKELKVIEEKLKRVNKHATCHFRVNRDQVFNLIEKAPSLAESAKLYRLADSAKLLDCTNPPIYLTENTKDYPPKAKGRAFKTWTETPKNYHPYFKACLEKPISLPEPSSHREITNWLATFNEWHHKGFTSAQVIDAAKRIRKLEKVISRPGSITWALQDEHSRSNGSNNRASSVNESIIAQLAQSQRRK